MFSISFWSLTCILNLWSTYIPPIVDWFGNGQLLSVPDLVAIQSPDRLWCFIHFCVPHVAIGAICATELVFVCLWTICKYGCFWYLNSIMSRSSKICPTHLKYVPNKTFQVVPFLAPFIQSFIKIKSKIEFNKENSWWMIIELGFKADDSKFDPHLG